VQDPLDLLGTVPAGVEVRVKLAGGQVSGALAVDRVHPRPRVQARDQQRFPQQERLAHPRQGADDEVGVGQCDVHPPPLLVGEHRDRVEEVDLAGLEQRPPWLLRTGHRLIGGVEHQVPFVALTNRGPHGAHLPAQRRREL
jgi:hypothetical protein